MILYEIMLAEVLDKNRNKDFDYLDRYLIETPIITLQEAKDLIKLCEQGESFDMKKLNSTFSARKERLKVKMNIKLDKAKGHLKDALEKGNKAAAEKSRNLIKTIKDQYNKQTEALSKAKDKAASAIKSNWQKRSGNVKAKWNAIPKKYRVAGGVAAGTIALGAAAMAAKKKKDKK